MKLILLKRSFMSLMSPAISGLKVVPDHAEFVRRVEKSGDWDRLLENVKKCDRSKLTDTVLQAFRCCDWSHEIFLKSDWILLSVLAYQEGKIEREDFVSLLLYDGYKRTGYEIKCFQLIRSDGSVNGDAVLAFKTGGKVVKNAFDFFVQREFLTEFEIEKLIQNLQSESPHRSQFFHLGFDERKISDLMIQEIIFATGYFFVSESVLPNDLANSDTHSYYTVQAPCPQLAAQTISVRYRHTARLPLYVLGFSPRERLSRFPTSRPVSVFLPGFEIPKIHTIKVSGLDCYLHDIFHCSVDSVNPYRGVFKDIALKLNRIDPVLTETLLDGLFYIVAFSYSLTHPKRYNLLAESPLVDMILSSFRIDLSEFESLLKNQQNGFWMELFLFFSQMIEKKDEILDQFIDCFLENELKWRELGINRESLNSLLHQLADALNRKKYWYKGFCFADLLYQISSHKKLQLKIQPGSLLSEIS